MTDLVRAQMNAVAVTEAALRSERDKFEKFKVRTSATMSKTVSAHKQETLWYQQTMETINRDVAIILEAKAAAERDAEAARMALAKVLVKVQQFVPMLRGARAELAAERIAHEETKALVVERAAAGAVGAWRGPPPPSGVWGVAAGAGAADARAAHPAA